MATSALPPEGYACGHACRASDTARASLPACYRKRHPHPPYPCHPRLTHVLAPAIRRGRQPRHLRAPLRSHGDGGRCRGSARLCALTHATRMRCGRNQLASPCRAMGVLHGSSSSRRHGRRCVRTAISRYRPARPMARPYNRSLVRVAYRAIRCAMAQEKLIHAQGGLCVRPANGWGAWERVRLGLMGVAVGGIGVPRRDSATCSMTKSHTRANRASW